uniref:Uncharacterized protein n=1 Tax=Rhizophora mucronata TaxID=61149 RepID=A0A2P2Q5S5_RHIMU
MLSLLFYIKNIKFCSYSKDAETRPFLLISKDSPLICLYDAALSDLYLHIHKNGLFYVSLPLPLL